VLSAAELTLQELASFAGLAQENMTAPPAGASYDIGRPHRARHQHQRASRDNSPMTMPATRISIFLLTLVDSQITYRSRYLLAPILAPVRDVAVLDPYNPRSVAFQVTTLNEHIAALAEPEGARLDRAAASGSAVAVQAMLATAEAEKLEVKTLFSLEQDLLSIAEAIGLHYFPHGPNASRPEKLTGLA